MVGKNFQIYVDCITEKCICKSKNESKFFYPPPKKKMKVDIFTHTPPGSILVDDHQPPPCSPLLSNPPPPATHPQATPPPPNASHPQAEGNRSYPPGSIFFEDLSRALTSYYHFFKIAKLWQGLCGETQDLTKFCTFKSLPSITSTMKDF